MKKKVLCIGEILWDSLPKGLFLGGAPFNVACHLHMLQQPTAVVSRVGDDALGKIIKSRLSERGISTEFIQVDSINPTGLVNVSLDDSGNATFDIVQPSAWDFIQSDERTIEAAQSSDVIVFGSLAQRNAKSRETILKILELGKLNIFDVNLRSPFDDPEVVADSLCKSQIVKLNDMEIIKLANWYGLSSEIKEAARGLMKKFGCKIICVTRGEKGAALFQDEEYTEHPGYSVSIKDTVGAGDAFLASFITGILNKESNSKILEDANALGAYVASKDGPTPKINFDEIYRIKNFEEK